MFAYRRRRARAADKSEDFLLFLSRGYSQASKGVKWQSSNKDVTGSIPFFIIDHVCKTLNPWLLLINWLTPCMVASTFSVSIWVWMRGYSVKCFGALMCSIYHFQAIKQNPISSINCKLHTDVCSFNGIMPVVFCFNVGCTWLLTLLTFSMQNVTTFLQPQTAAEAKSSLTGLLPDYPSTPSGLPVLLHLIMLTLGRQARGHISNSLSRQWNTYRPCMETKKL